MNELRAFAPAYTGSKPNFQGKLLPSTTIAATDAAAPTSRFAGTSQNNLCQIQIGNLSTSWAYVSFGVFGDVKAATVAADYPVPPGSVVVVSVDPEVSGASVILGTASATGNVIFTRGAGL